MGEEIVYEDIPDYCGYCPDCPECGGDMGYNALEGEFKCSECGFILDESDWIRDEDDNDPIPDVCISCGGPYPTCVVGCKILDD